MIIVNPGIGDHLSVFTEEIPVALIAEPVRGFAVAFIVEIVGTVLEFQEPGGLGAVVLNILLLIFCGFVPLTCHGRECAHQKTQDG